MADIATAGIAAVQGLFTYNRDAFTFERTMRQAMVYQQQNMRVQEADLYRQDLRDLFDITIKKMDNYLIIITLMIGFTISLFCITDMPEGTPIWLFWLYSASLAGSFFFLLVAMWLALQASLTAQAYSVRLLTQWMRLPVPRRREISEAAASVGDYEKMGAGRLLRLPVLEKENVDTDESDASSTELTRSNSGIIGGQSMMVTKPIHFRLFLDLQTHWQTFDAYSRICMVLGTNQLLQAVADVALAVYLMNFGQVWACLIFVSVIYYAVLLHMQLHLSISGGSRVLSHILLLLVPVFTILACVAHWRRDVVDHTVCAIGGICSFFSHFIWLGFCFYQGLEHRSGLPLRYTTVGLASDIIGDGAMRKSIDKVLSRLGRKQTDLPVTVAENLSPEEKCLRIEAKIQKLFKTWKSGNISKDRFEFMKVKFQRLQSKLRETLNNNEIERMPSSMSLGQPVSPRSLTDKVWVRMQADEGLASASYYLNAVTGEIRVDDHNNVDAADKVGAGSEEEQLIQAEMSEFAKFVREIQAQAEKGSSESDNTRQVKRNKQARKRRPLPQEGNWQGLTIFRQAAALMLLVWASGCVWVLVHFYDSSMTGDGLTMKPLSETGNHMKRNVV